MKTKRKIKNVKKFIKSTICFLLILIFFMLIVHVLIDFIEYPENYLTTWKYQLHREIQNGDQEAINYYQRKYLDNGKKLWED